MFLNGKIGRLDDADSGEDDGEGSGIKGESNVECVVAGEDPVDAVVMEVTLSRWWREREEQSVVSEGGFAVVTVY